MRIPALIATLTSSPAVAENHVVFLETVAGQKVEIAQLSVTETKDYSLSFNDAAFSDHFLSMRPFKCLEGPNTHWCHLPYPYEIKRNLAQDLIDLEYDLLFLWKSATDYGIDTWNGIYYRLAPEGRGWRGQMYEIDLGQLGIPPAADDLRPISQADLHETDASSHWLPHLVIAPKD